MSGWFFLAGMLFTTLVVAAFLFGVWVGDRL